MKVEETKYEDKTRKKIEEGTREVLNSSSIEGRVELEDEIKAQCKKNKFQTFQFEVEEPAFISSKGEATLNTEKELNPSPFQTLESIFSKNEVLEGIVNNKFKFSKENGKKIGVSGTEIKASHFFSKSLIDYMAKFRAKKYTAILSNNPWHKVFPSNFCSFTSCFRAWDGEYKFANHGLIQSPKMWIGYLFKSWIKDDPCEKRDFNLNGYKLPKKFARCLYIVKKDMGVSRGRVFPDSCLWEPVFNNLAEFLFRLFFSEKDFYATSDEQSISFNEYFYNDWFKNPDDCKHFLLESDIKFKYQNNTNPLVENETETEEDDDSSRIGCACCGNSVYEGDAFYYRGENYCPHCWNNRDIFECEDCTRYFSEPEIREHPRINGGYICFECYDNLPKCTSCNTLFSIQENGLCYSCNREKEERRNNEDRATASDVQNQTVQNAE